MAIESVENDTPLVDEAGLDELRSIMEEEFVDVLQVFLEESVNLMSEIHTGFEEESENLIRVVHTLKSCSKNVGAMRLGGIAEKMEACLVRKDVATAKTNLEELQDVFTQSHVLIKQCMQNDMHNVA